MSSILCYTVFVRNKREDEIMSRNNYFTIENLGGVYRVVLANINGKRVGSREVFPSRAAAMANAVFMAQKSKVRFINPILTA